MAARADRMFPRPSAIRALMHRDFAVSRSYRIAFVMDVLFGLVNLAIYYFISETFDDLGTSDLGGAPSYFAFAAVGVALSLVVSVASLRVAQRLREEQLTGALEMLVAQPVTTLELAFGLAGFHFLFAIVRAIFYLLVAALVVSADFANADWVGFIVMVTTTGCAMAAVGIAVGAAALVLKRAELLSGLVLLALSLLGGAYFPIDVLPAWIQPLAEILPTTFAFDGVRAALYRGDGWALPAVELLGFALVALPISVWGFGSALSHGRRRGSLSTP